MSLELNEKKPLIAIIILNWNGVDDTIECINSLLQSTYDRFKIIVVDNASHGNDVARLKEKFSSNIDIFENSRNDGYAQGNNIGIHRARNKYHPDHFWILNNDTVVHVDALAELVKYVQQNPDRAIVGSYIQYWQSDLVYCLGGGVMNLWTGIDYLWGAKIDSRSSFIPKNFSYISGCSLFFSTKVITSIKGFDPDYFLYGEEVDFCFRSIKAGYQLGYADHSVIYHKSASSATYPPHYIYYFLRNKLLFMKKNARPLNRVLFLPTFIFYYCLGFSWRCFRKNGYIPVKIILKSIMDFIFGRFADQAIPPR